MYVDKAMEMATLMMQLAELEVPLPDDLVRAGEQLLRIPTLRPQPSLPAKVIGLTDDEMRVALRDLGIGLALAGEAVTSGSLAEARLGEALAGELAAELRPRADEIIEHLRPRFDQAAQAMHAATELGLHPRISNADILRSDDVVRMRDAFAEVLKLAGELDHIALARIQLSTAAGVPPDRPARSMFDSGQPPSVLDVAGTMFRDDGQLWFVDREDGWQRWLRLSMDSAASLLTIDETMSALELVRA